MLYHSGEIRWFLEGAPGENVRRWFLASGLSREFDERTDEYLVLPRCTTVGVKLREGRFEIKAATGPTVPVCLTNGMRGVKGPWVKWSSGRVDEAPLRALLSGDASLVIAVQKRRILRLVSLDGDAPEEIAPGTRRLEAGCQAELGMLRVPALQGDGAADQQTGARRVWTLSLEAFGNPDSVMANLDRAAEFLFSDDFGMHADETVSLSYPEWLGRQVPKLHGGN